MSAPALSPSGPAPVPRGHTGAPGGPVPPEHAAVPVQQVLPLPGPRDLRALLPALAGAPTLRPFAPEALAFCAQLSRALSRRSRHLPEVAALAYWMRRSAVAGLATEFAALADRRSVLVPRGTVFHVPPANVDTVFVYSWLLSVLCGNRNLVRLSGRAGSAAALLVEVLGEVLAEHPAVRDTTAMVRYGHDAAATDAASAACDLRVIWGGDTTVAAVRRSPLPAHAVDLTFADRTSVAAIRVGAYAALDDAGRDALVRDFFTDTYWFDQLGCSSPRAVVWVGGERECAELGGDFFARLAREVERRGYTVDTAGAIAKLAFAHRTMVDQPVTSYAAYGNGLTVLDVARFPQLGGEFCGAGTFLSYRIGSLAELAGHVDRRVQTLTRYGFDRAELRELAVALNGRGIDRIVAFGQALTFDRVWDGHDLLQAFTRRVTLG